MAIRVLPLDAFFAKLTTTNYDISSPRNQDAPNLIDQQAQMLLKRMRPQGRKPVVESEVLALRFEVSGLKRGWCAATSPDFVVETLRLLCLGGATAVKTSPP